LDIVAMPPKSSDDSECLRDRFLAEPTAAMNIVRRMANTNFYPLRS